MAVLKWPCVFRWQQTPTDRRQCPFIPISTSPHDQNPPGKNAVDFAEFMKMMSKNGTDTAKEVKEAFTIFNASGRCVTPRWTPF